MALQGADESVVRLIGVEKVYESGSVKVPALRGVDFTLKTGSFAACAGPSGSGKTTLLNLIGCLDRPTAGQIFLEDEAIHTRAPSELADVRERHIGFIFQSFNLIPVLSAFENVEFPLLLRPEQSAAQRRDAVMKLLTDVGLGEMAHRRPAELSGGQQQRVAVARALVKKPSLVLADEPTANLDSDTGREILELMATMNEKYETTFLFSTHDQMVMDFARRLILLHDGQIQEDRQQEGRCA